MNFNKKANIIFYIIFISGFFILSSVLLSILLLRSYVFVSIKNFFGHAVSLCDCVSLSMFGNSIYKAGILVVFSILTLFLIFAVFKILGILYSTNKFIKESKDGGVLAHNLKIRDVLRVNKINKKDVEYVFSDDAFVFCYGFLNPKICISKALVENLSFEELSSVIRHEYKHKKTYEPLRLFIIHTLRSVLFFIPKIKNLADNYNAFAEIAADEYATYKFKNRKYLASAIDKVLKFEEDKIVKKIIPLSYFGTSIDKRITVLAGESKKLSASIFKSFVSISIFFSISFFVLFLSFYLYNFSKPVSNGVSCLNNVNKSVLIFCDSF